MAECEPDIRLGCRNKDSCNPSGLGLPFDEGEEGKKKKKRKNKTKQKNPFHVLTWILGVILSVQLERKKKPHPTRGQA